MLSDVQVFSGAGFNKRALSRGKKSKTGESRLSDAFHRHLTTLKRRHWMLAPEIALRPRSYLEMPIARGSR